VSERHREILHIKGRGRKKERKREREREVDRHRQNIVEKAKLMER
jgi:hypothetical protein